MACIFEVLLSYVEYKRCGFVMKKELKSEILGNMTFSRQKLNIFLEFHDVEFPGLNAMVEHDYYDIFWYDHGDLYSSWYIWSWQIMAWSSSNIAWSCHAHYGHYYNEIRKLIIQRTVLSSTQVVVCYFLTQNMLKEPSKLLRRRSLKCIFSLKIRYKLKTLKSCIIYVVLNLILNKKLLPGCHRWNEDFLKNPH